MQEHLHFFLTSLILATILSFMALRNGYFHLEPQSIDRKWRPSLGDIAGAFGLFLLIELVLVPGVAGAYLLWRGTKLDTLTQGWFGLLAILISSLALLSYSLILPQPKRRGLFWGEGVQPSLNKFFRDFCAGAGSWLLSYPWVIVVGHLVAVIMLLFGPLPEADQVAVKQLKISQQNPQLFASMLLAIVFFVPLAEELLFRGFLQRGMRLYLTPWKSIGVTSAIFALFHFSTTQGWNNIELILSLFILSCYLGLIYEKRGSIWAPVGLHMMFNAISVALILWQEGVLA